MGIILTHSYQTMVVLAIVIVLCDNQKEKRSGLWLSSQVLHVLKIISSHWLKITDLADQFFFLGSLGSSTSPMKLVLFSCIVFNFTTCCQEHYTIFHSPPLFARVTFSFLLAPSPFYIVSFAGIDTYKENLWINNNHDFKNAISLMVLLRDNFK